MVKTVKAGIIGCGNISQAYFNAAEKLDILDVMLAFDESSASGTQIEIQSTCQQPAALPMNLPKGKLDA